MIKKLNRNVLQGFVFSGHLGSLSEKLCASQQTEETLGKFDISQNSVSTNAGGAESPSAFSKSFEKISKNKQFQSPIQHVQTLKLFHKNLAYKRMEAPPRLHLRHLL